MTALQTRIFRGFPQLIAPRWGTVISNFFSVRHLWSIHPTVRRSVYSVLLTPTQSNAHKSSRPLPAVFSRKVSCILDSHSTAMQSSYLCEIAVGISHYPLIVNCSSLNRVMYRRRNIIPPFNLFPSQFNSVRIFRISYLRHSSILLCSLVSHVACIYGVWYRNCFTHLCTYQN
jgi:hypothetical protein